MYIPIIDEFKKAEKSAEVKELRETMKVLEGTFDDIADHVDIEHKTKRKPKNNEVDDKRSSYEKLQAYVRNMKKVIQLAETINNDKELFSMLYDNYEDIHNSFWFEPMFHMIQSFVVSEVEKVKGSSEFFEADVIVKQNKNFPILFFTVKNEKLEEIEDFNKVYRSANVYSASLVPSDNHSVVLELHTNNLPSSEFIRETRRDAETMIKLLETKLKKPFFLRFASKDRKERWEAHRNASIRKIDKEIDYLKKDLKRYESALSSPLETERVEKVNKVLEQDLKEYVDKINEALGSRLDVKVKYN